VPASGHAARANASRNWAITQLLCEELEGLALEWPEADFDVAEELRRVRSVA